MAGAWGLLPRLGTTRAWSQCSARVRALVPWRALYSSSSHSMSPNSPSSSSSTIPPTSSSSSSSPSSPSSSSAGAAGQTATPKRHVVSLPELQAKHTSGTPLSMLTAYDYTSARLAASGRVDMLLVGDSLGQVMLGYDNTAQVTMEEMLHHCAAVTRALDSGTAPAPHRPWVICDLPFGSYTDPQAAVANGVRCVKEGRADAVKLEGGTHAPAVIEQVRALVAAGIPVMGHIGLTPQTATALGGYSVQGRSTHAALRLLEDAIHLQAAGCFSVVLEMVPGKIAEHITQTLAVPTIGIGAGAGTSGQVLVFHDVIGLFDRFVPRFCKQYTSAGETISTALQAFQNEVQAHAFPTKEHTFLIKSDVLREFREQAPATVQRAEAEASAAATRTDTPSGSKRGYCTVAAAAAMDPVNASVGTPLVFPQHSTSRSLHSSNSHRNSVYRTQSAMNRQPPSVSSSSPSSWKSRLENLQVAVIGGGAMGSLLAARLGLYLPRPVSLVTSWREQILAIEGQGGLQLEPFGTNVTPAAAPVHVIDAEKISGPPTANVALVMTKSASTAQAARVARRLLRADGIVVTLQNGVGNHGILCSELPGHAVVTGVTTDGARIERPGKVVHTGMGDTLVAGGQDLDSSGLVTELLAAAGFACKQINDPQAMESVVWGKLLINCAINPVTAILDVPNGQLLQSPEALAMIEDVVSEALLVANRKGVVVPFDDPLQQVHRVLDQTADNFSSMLADVRRGVPTEIDFINGHVVKEGRAMRVRTPMNACLLHAVKSISNAKTAASTPHVIGQGDPSTLMPQMLALGHVPIPSFDHKQEVVQAEQQEKEKQQRRQQQPQQQQTQQQQQQQQQQKGEPTFKHRAGMAKSKRSSTVILRTADEMRAYRQALKRNNTSPSPTDSGTGETGEEHVAAATTPAVSAAGGGELPVLGFVPTMGCLHRGHLALVEQSLCECDATVVSIFVNPLQFAPNEDLDTYPRTVEDDMRRLKDMGVDAIFLPTHRVMYPFGDPNARVVVENATQQAEGRSRPHFFDGVATVAAKLFNIVQPDSAYFGQKDAQQCATIRSLIRDLNFNVCLRIGPTVREEDGLAMSSRNLRLPAELRPKAAVLYRSLLATQRAYAAGERSPIRLKQEAMAVLRSVPELAVHYVDVADAATMQPLVEWPALDSQQICVSVAATLGGVRLLDNILLP